MTACSPHIALRPERKVTLWPDLIACGLAVSGKAGSVIDEAVPGAPHSPPQSHEESSTLRCHTTCFAQLNKSCAAMKFAGPFSGSLQYQIQIQLLTQILEPPVVSCIKPTSLQRQSPRSSITITGWHPIA